MSRARPHTILILTEDQERYLGKLHDVATERRDAMIGAAAAVGLPKPMIADAVGLSVSQVYRILEGSRQCEKT